MLRPPPRSTRTDTLFPYTTLFRARAAAGLTIGVIGGQIDALRHLHGCTGEELPCEANRAVILAQRLEVGGDRAEAHADIGLEGVDRKRVVEGKRVEVSGELGGGRRIKKDKNKTRRTEIAPNIEVK